MTAQRIGPNSGLMERLQQTAASLEALGSPTRFEICRLSVVAGRDGWPVGKNQQAIGTPASTRSYRLKRLEIVGLVRR